MLTDTTGTVDARDAGLLLTVSEIARTKGVSKQNISKRIAKLREQGLLQAQAGPRGALLVSLAEYDRVTGETSELAYAQAPRPSAPRGADADPVYTREQARAKSYEADLKKLDLDERLGKLLPVERVEDAAVRLGETMVRQLDQMAGRAEDAAAAIAKDGTAGARAFLKTLARDIREAMARDLEQLALTAQAAHDAPAPDTDA